jgi:hypothetical protein
MIRTDLLSIIRSLNTVFTATGICHISYVDCLLARSGCSSFLTSLAFIIRIYRDAPSSECQTNPTSPQWIITLSKTSQKSPLTNYQSQTEGPGEIKKQYGCSDDDVKKYMSKINLYFIFRRTKVRK